MRAEKLAILCGRGVEDTANSMGKKAPKSPIYSGGKNMRLACESLDTTQWGHDASQG
jgi:hypothetical protein